MHVTFAAYTCRVYAHSIRMTSGFGRVSPLALERSPQPRFDNSGRSFAYSFFPTPPRGAAQLLFS